ncbi:hypothetical protein PM082_024936 [Marasmius tenuissimus]|nr:hypothetical protein PM082_024936 [Marasmius tenuissimus]
MSGQKMTLQYRTSGSRGSPSKKHGPTSKKTSPVNPLSPPEDDSSAALTDILSPPETYLHTIRIIGKIQWTEGRKNKSILQNGHLLLARSQLDREMNGEFAL